MNKGGGKKALKTSLFWGRSIIPNYSYIAVSAMHLGVHANTAFHGFTLISQERAYPYRQLSMNAVKVRISWEHDKLLNLAYICGLSSCCFWAKEHFSHMSHHYCSVFSHLLE